MPARTVYTPSQAPAPVKYPPEADQRRTTPSSVLFEAVLRGSGALEAKKRDLARISGQKERVSDRLALAERGQALIQQAARQTQEQLQYQISDLVTAALQAVFPRPYEFKLVFAEVRGRTEASTSLVRGGVVIEDPLNEMGGGVVDVIAFALRIAMWSLAPAVRRERPVLILDEPFRFLSADLRERAAALMQELCERLGLQIIMVTHEPAFVRAAAKVHEFSMGENGVTRLAGSVVESVKTAKVKRTRG